MKSIGDEYTWAKEALQDLASDGIEAKHLTTDPDSSAYRAADDLYLENTTSTEPEHFLDTRHFLNNHRKNIKNDKELGEIMPGRTKKDREKLLNNFALDLAERCQSEFTQAMEIYGGDFVKVKNKISFTVDAIPACYTGNHELCRRHSFVCRVHSAIHSVNLGPGESLLVICKQLGAEISPGSAAEKELKAIQKTDRMQKAYKKTMKYKKERSDTRKHLYKIYEKHQEEKCYEKNKLMRPVKHTKTQVEDHPYAKKTTSCSDKKC
ncbi:unnamed protein product [Mytilus coruscus]|uniref:Uncharacterized protein n=1 Tax=Mytilus coruscus TaxID=42192 RepID=A0A6J8C518_MYTCO|nr:unnamed protein product [Mytilus coruscus]